MGRTKPVCVWKKVREKRGREGIEERDPYPYDFLASHHQVTNSFLRVISITALLQ